MRSSDSLNSKRNMAVTRTPHRSAAIWLLVVWLVTGVAGTLDPCCFALSGDAHAGTAHTAHHAEHASSLSTRALQPEGSSCDSLDQTPIIFDAAAVGPFDAAPPMPASHRRATLYTTVTRYTFSDTDIGYRGDVPIYLRTSRLLI